MNSCSAIDRDHEILLYEMAINQKDCVRYFWPLLADRGMACLKACLSKTLMLPLLGTCMLGYCVASRRGSFLTVLYVEGCQAIRPPGDGSPVTCDISDITVSVTTNDIRRGI